MEKEIIVIDGKEFISEKRIISKKSKEDVQRDIDNCDKKIVLYNSLKDMFLEDLNRFNN